MTAEEWAEYAIPGTEPDADGWYPDYLPLPADMPPDEPPPAADAQQSEVDTSWLAIVTHWRYVAVDLITLHGVDLWDPAVRARPWPGVRNLIFSLLEPDSPSRLRRALTRR